MQHQYLPPCSIVQKLGIHPEDYVKFQKRSWHMRNQLKVTSKDHEQPTWIRIPTKNKTSNELIMNVALDNDHNWKKTHLKTFEFNYGINIEQIPFLQKLYKKECFN